jgi:broad specificity phosphatase PhoE
MSSLIRLYLARHGRTAWNQAGRFQGHSDVPLDEAGREQAAALAQALRGQVQAVIASDLLRASETARIVAHALEIPLLALDSDLRERGYGVFEGLTRVQCIEQHPAIWAAREADRNHEPPGGEPRAVVLARMQRGLQRAVERLHGSHDSALVVGHGSSLRMFIEVLTGAPVESFANMEFRELWHDANGFALAPLGQRSSARASGA